MVDSETTPTTDAANRLITFELDGDELLYVAAGRGELENRTIYHDYAQGRYAIVPVDELARTHQPPEYELVGDPKFEDLRIIGESTTLVEPGTGEVALTRNGQQVTSFTNRGVYGLIWLPYE